MGRCRHPVPSEGQKTIDGIRLYSRKTDKNWLEQREKSQKTLIL